MIDREARDKAAEILRQFVSGRISNFALEKRFPESDDPALWAIEDTLWCFYDDLQEHTMTGTREIPAEWKSIMARWVMFLHSGCEYVWPKISYPGLRPLKSGLLARLLFLDRWRRRRESHFMAHGEHAYWPFADKASFDESRARPTLLPASADQGLSQDR